MKAKIYIVSYVSFDGYDDNLYTEVKTFTDRDKAEAFYRRSVDTARSDARREEDSDDEDEWTPISEDESDREYNVSRDDDECYFTRVELTEQEIESTPETQTKMAIGEYLYHNISMCLYNIANETDYYRQRLIIRHILHSLRENCITED